MERIEGHDVINAVALAAVLLAMALALVFGARALFSTVDDGVVDASKTTIETLPPGDASTPTPETTTTTEPTTTAPSLHQPNEVTTRVGNGAQRSGIAGAGTGILDQAGYVTLSPKNAAPTDSSAVFYVDGYQADAAQIARLLGVDESLLIPMPSDPPIPQEGAQVLAILGRDTTVG